MEDWYYKFESMLLNDQESCEDLIGAGQSSATQAVAHYRYQQKAKVYEAIGDTFPVLKSLAGEGWNTLLESFHSQNRNSPRSLDFISKVFLDYIIDQELPFHWKELARFEHALEIHSWNHCEHDPVPLDVISEDNMIVLHPLDIQIFQAPVVELYDSEAVLSLEGEERVLIWVNAGHVRYRKMETWELKILKTLPEGIAMAVEHAPDEKKATEFFTWLGNSNLISRIFRR